METVIDWSKAPEGTTHFDPVDRNHLKQDGKNAMMWNLMAGWIQKGWQYPDELSTMHRLWVRPQWTGEGLPPVGTVCEWHPSVHGWVQVTILGHDGEDTWYRVKGEDHTQTCRNMAFFRPIRTPEQIAAEEREASIQALKQIFDSCSDELMPTSNKYLDVLFGAIHDAGYRKQVSP